MGLLLLVDVVRSAVRPAPWPLRTFANDPPVLLPFFAPHTWIVAVCVAGALRGHVVTLTWLSGRRGATGDGGARGQSPST